MRILACGNCLWNDAYLRFPAISSLSGVLICSCLSLSSVRLFWPSLGRGSLPVSLLMPLLVGTLILAPATFGPYVGIWIPVACFSGLWGLLRNRDDKFARRLGIGITAVTLIASLAFGTLDYQEFYRMNEPEKEALRPVWNHGQQRIFPD